MAVKGNYKTYKLDDGSVVTAVEVAAVANITPAAVHSRLKRSRDPATVYRDNQMNSTPKPSTAALRDTYGTIVSSTRLRDMEGSSKLNDEMFVLFMKTIGVSKDVPLE